jgi:hypothetical protein
VDGAFEEGASFSLPMPTLKFRLVKTGTVEVDAMLQLPYHSTNAADQPRLHGHDSAGTHIW